jgi:hypothetical protein
MTSRQRCGWFASLVAAGWLLAGCGIEIGPLVSVGPIDRSLAETYARFGSGVSLAAIDVVDARLSTYGAERPGGSLRASDAQVWVVTLSGSFPIGGCRIDIGLLGSAPPATPCPTPAAWERVLVDAGNGDVIEVIPGG